MNGIATQIAFTVYCYRDRKIKRMRTSKFPQTNTEWVCDRNLQLQLNTQQMSTTTTTTTSQNLQNNIVRYMTGENDKVAIAKTTLSIGSSKKMRKKQCGTKKQFQWKYQIHK